MFGRETSTARQNDEYVAVGKVRLAHIDVLRALAALAVFFVHIEQYWLGAKRPRGANLPALLTHLASLGTAGVDIFIVLSGFCLSYPLYRGGRTVPRHLLTVPFYKRRAFRILPAYYAAVLIFFALEWYPPIQRKLVGYPVLWYDPIVHALGLQTLFRETVSSINGPFWSIALELQLYLVFPLLVALVRRHGVAAGVGVSVAVFALWYPAVRSLSGASVGFAHLGDLTLLLPARWFEFAFGLAAARVVANPRPWHRRACLFGLLLSLPLAVFGEGTSHLIPRTFGWSLFAASLVVIGPLMPGSLWTKAPLVAMQRLGVISFSFYLVHQPIQLLLGGPVRHLELGITATFALAASLGVGLTALVAYLSFRLFERPFLVSGGMAAAVRD